MSNLTNLQILSLNNNALYDLKQVLLVLKKLSCLKELDLFGNPLDKQINYSKEGFNQI